jgi:hypothetical protein
MNNYLLNKIYKNPFDGVFCLAKKRIPVFVMNNYLLNKIYKNPFDGVICLAKKG